MSHKFKYKTKADRLKKLYKLYGITPKMIDKEKQRIWQIINKWGLDPLRLFVVRHNLTDKAEEHFKEVLDKIEADFYDSEFNHIYFYHKVLNSILMDITLNPIRYGLQPIKLDEDIINFWSYENYDKYDDNPYPRQTAAELGLS